MKKKLLLLSFLSLALVILQSSINGVTTTQLLDRTNSPVTSGNCSACHSGGSFESNMTIELIDINDKIVTNYIPGESYTVKYTLNATGAAKFGLQSTILGSDSSMAGTLTAKSANTAAKDLNSRTYIDHKTASTANIFEATWKAPSTDIGIVTIYSSGLAANGNSGTTGDKPINIDPISISRATQGIANPKLILNVYPNPTIESLTIESAETPQFIEIYNIKGQLQLSISNTREIATKTLNAGIYIVKVKIDNQVFQQKVLKN